ncbi:MAG: hypothetical protein HC802_13870 [Caldilineaceae bacterium]|nr:hypothetical protein [Caldilineaceae bacterium]
MKLGCFVSNRGLREMSFADFVQAAVALGYDSVDVPAGRATLSHFAANGGWRSLQPKRSFRRT